MLSAYDLVLALAMWNLESAYDLVLALAMWNLENSHPVNIYSKFTPSLYLY